MAKDKNRPQEVSSKQQVSVLRQAVPNAKVKPHDPRFDRAMGSLNEDLFKKSYGFLEDVQKNERTQIENAIKTEKNPFKLESLKKLSQRLNSREQTRKREEARKKILRERKKVESELVAQGKRPFYLKKGDIKKLELMERFKEIKAKAHDKPLDIDKLVESRRRHKASKQHKFMPDV